MNRARGWKSIESVTQEGQQMGMRLPEVLSNNQTRVWEQDASASS